jgi:hypothetical protein
MANEVMRDAGNVFSHFYKAPTPSFTSADFSGLDAYARDQFRAQVMDAYPGADEQFGWLLEPAAAPLWNQISRMFLPNSTATPTQIQGGLDYVFRKAGMSSSSSGSGSSGYNVAQATEQFKAVIQNYQGQMGLEGNFDDLAATAAANHWSPDMLRDALAAHIDIHTTERPGIVHDAIDKIRAAASEYFVTYNDDELLGFAKKIAAEDMNIESALGDVRDRAKQQYSWLANTIDSGTTLKQYFQPHRETIAKLLELGNGDNVDLMNSKWRDIVHKAPTDKDPVDRSLTVAETERYVRQMNEWRNTNNAKASFSAGAVALGRVMGKIA